MVRLAAGARAALQRARGLADGGADLSDEPLPLSASLLAAGAASINRICRLVGASPRTGRSVAAVDGWRVAVALAPERRRRRGLPLAAHRDRLDASGGGPRGTHVAAPGHSCLSRARRLDRGA